MFNQIIFRLKSKVLRTMIKYSKDPRPNSNPYISGDGFRKIADHLYDETYKCSANEIKNREIVFVKADYLPKFFREVHPLIRDSYVLISHNSDYNVTEADTVLIDEKIIYWYAQNVTVGHPKLIPLPIGLENLHIGVDGLIGTFNYCRKKISKIKKNRILFGFNKQTNPLERGPAEEVLNQSSVADGIKTRVNPDQHARLLNQYKFVASPPGNGLDCHRTWEAMYLKTIPIVKRSPAMEYFQSLGLPMWLVDNWSEIATLTESDLGLKYEEIMANSNENALFMDYWIKLIKQDRTPSKEQELYP